MSHAVEACPSCKHPYAGHTSDGCWHHTAGVICECRALPPRDVVEKTHYVSIPLRIDEIVPKLLTENRRLEEQLRVQTERAERLDKENDARFTRETEYQNRIRMLEQKLRDVASYAARDLPQR